MRSMQVASGHELENASKSPHTTIVSKESLMISNPSIWKLPEDTELRRRQPRTEGDRVCTSVYLPIGLHARIAELAKVQGLSVSAMITEITMRSMQKDVQ